MKKIKKSITLFIFAFCILGSPLYGTPGLEGLLALFTKKTPSFKKLSIEETIQKMADQNRPEVDQAPADDEPDILLEKIEAQRHVLLIAGPGGRHFGPGFVTEIAHAIETLDSQAAKVNFKKIGDGEDSLTQESIGEALTELSNTLGRVMIIVVADGHIKDHRLSLQISRKKAIKAHILLEMIAKNFPQRPVDVLFTASHGGEALLDAHQMAEGSRLVVLSGSNERVIFSDVERLIPCIKEIENPMKLSAVTILYHYLIHALEEKHSTPQLAIAGGRIYNPRQNLNCRIGIPWGNETQSRAHQILDPIIGAERVEEILQEIETASTIEDIGPKNYGTALALVFATMENHSSEDDL